MVQKKKTHTRKSKHIPEKHEPVFANGLLQVVNFGQFLRKRREWLKYRIVIFRDPEHPTTLKGVTYFIRILKRGVEYITRWDESLTPPIQGGQLLPQKFYMVVETRKVSKKIWEKWASWFQPHRTDVYWIFLGEPSVPADIFTPLKNTCLVIDDPYIPEQKIGDWFFAISKAYGIEIKKTYVDRIVSVLLYDQFRLIQLAETLASAYGNKRLEWVDIEPFLPSTHVFPSGRIVFQWVRDKNYRNLINLVHQTEKKTPSFQAILHQGYETWRTWTLLNRCQHLSEHDIKRLWGSWIIRMRDHLSNQNQLTSFQLLQWARIASYWEVKCRHGAVDERTAFLTALFEWLRVIA